MKNAIPTTILALLSSSLSIAENLEDLYLKATKFDPVLQQAQEQYLATRQKKPQAIASFLPAIDITASSTGTSSTNDLLKNYNTYSYKLSVSQPIFNFTNWSSHAQANSQIKSSLATLNDANQSLITRVANQYFAILKAEDDLTFAQSERKAFARQLEQIKQRFKVGLIAITDVHEAQARHDSAFAEEISAKNVLEDQKEIMREIIKHPVTKIAKLKTKLKYVNPKPSNIEKWVETSVQQNYALLAAKYNLQVAKEQIRVEYSSHMPTIDLSGNLTRSKNIPTTKSKTTTGDFGLTLSIPVFSGGNISFRTIEAMHLFEAEAENYEQVLRQTKSSTRQAYRGVLTKISQAKALKQAVQSSTSALKATKAAFEVGTRTIVDVLNAESDLLDAKRLHKRARYDYILETFALKKAAGTLSVEDLAMVNSWLEKEK